MKALLPLALIGAIAAIGAAIYLTDLWRRRKPAASPPTPPYDHGSDEILTRALWRDQADNPTATDGWPGGTPPWMPDEWKP